ncbi:hypothetical protein GE09DRAFT_306398 [Coniochaeta sp. 2T2.1]|nr:hypothetical protein GE09DRAFT_306398 [Coniochaeta sp. 2T2.1]
MPSLSIFHSSYRQTQSCSCCQTVLTSRLRGYTSTESRHQRPSRYCHHPHPVPGSLRHTPRGQRIPCMPSHKTPQNLPALDTVRPSEIHAMFNFLQPFQPLYDYLTVEIPINTRLLLLTFQSRCLFTEIFLRRVLAFTLGRVLTFDVVYLLRSGLLVLAWVCACAAFLVYVSAITAAFRSLRRRPRIDWRGLFLKTVMAGVAIVCCVMVTRKWMGMFVSPFELMRLAVSEEGVCVPRELFGGSY